MVRMEVLDVDPLKNDLIDKYIGTLPGCQELQVARYEQQAQFSMPIAMESISIALPQIKRHHEPNMDSIQQHQLHLKVRAWGVTSSAASSRNTPYSPFNTLNTRNTHTSRTQYGTQYGAAASPSDGYTTTESSRYGASRQIGTSFGTSSNSGYDRQGYPASSRRTYSSINP